MNGEKIISKRGIAVIRLANLRKDHNLSQSDLAEILHISQQTVCNYETEKSEPDIKTLNEMADYFNTSIDYIVGRTNNMTPYSDINDKICIERLSRTERTHLMRYRLLLSRQKQYIDSMMKDLVRK